MLAALLAGCGGGGGAGTAQLRRGKAVFERSCSGCHSLAGHDLGRPGGDLAVAPLTSAEIASFVRVMPVRLSPGDVAAVAAYVHSVGAARRGG